MLPHLGEQRLRDPECDLELPAQAIVHVRQDRYVEAMAALDIARRLSGFWRCRDKRDAHGMKPMTTGVKLLEPRHARLAPSSVKEAEHEGTLREQLSRPYQPSGLIGQKELGKCLSQVSR